MEEWYVAHTKAREETKALFHLQRQGFAAYLPRYRKNRRHARRLETVVYPLFPRYVFVRMDVECTQWRCISSTLGVSHLICRNGSPAMIAGSVISDIAAREDEDGFVHLDDDGPGFVPGQAVMIKDGPLADNPGLFCASSDDRVLVMLEFLGRPVTVRVPKEFLRVHA